MTTHHAGTLRAVRTLLKQDEDRLYEELGKRARAMAANPKVAASFAPRVIYEKRTMGILDDLREFGRRLFRRWNEEAYNLVCGSQARDEKDRKDLLEAVGIGDAAVVAAVISGGLVAYLGVAPALAAVIAALIVKRFWRPTYAEFCHCWKRAVRRRASR